MVSLALEQRFYNTVTPLERPVRCRDRATGFELCRGRQQVNTIGPVMQHGGNGGIRVNHDQHVQHFHRLLHLDTTGLRVWRVPPENHGPDVVGLVHVLLVFKDTVNPARYRDAGKILEGLFLAIGAGDAVELAGKPFGIFLPYARPMCPGALGQTIIAGQRVRQNTKVGRALHVVMAAEDVGTATRGTHVAQRKLEDAIRTRIVVAVGMLRTTHAPDHGAGAVVHQGPGHAAQLGTRCTGDALHLFGSPLGHFGADLVHAPHPGADEFLVFPPVFENVPQDTPDQSHVRARTETHIFVGMGCGACETRVTHDQRRVVLFLRTQNMQQRNGVRLGGVASDNKDRAAVVDVVVAVGHGAVAPCIGNTRNGGRVTDPGLVIHVVRAPVGGEFAEQIGLFVGMLGRAKPVDAVRPAFFADFHHAVADLVDRLFPADALPLAALFLHRVFQTALAMGMFTNRCPLGAMGAQIERAVPAGLLPDPDAVAHLGHDGTADRAMRTNGFHGVHGRVRGVLRLGLSYRAAGHTDRGQSANGEARSAQERTAIDSCLGCRRQDTCPLGASRNPVGLFPKHVSLPCSPFRGGWVRFRKPDRWASRNRWSGAGVSVSVSGRRSRDATRPEPRSEAGAVVVGAGMRGVLHLVAGQIDGLCLGAFRCHHGHGRGGRRRGGGDFQKITPRCALVFGWFAHGFLLGSGRSGARRFLERA